MSFFSISFLRKVTAVTVFAVVCPALGNSLLYQAAIPVVDQSQEQRRLAAKQALKEVLVKLSGNDNVAANPAIEQALGRAPQLIQQYQYRANPVADIELAEGEQRKPQVLEVIFPEAQVRQILREAGEAFWPENRPKVLVWLVEDTLERGKSVLNGYSDSALVSSLQVSASARGLPLVFPLLDLEDTLAAPVDALWRMEKNTVAQASERYNPAAVLIGRISTSSSGRVIGTWHFSHRGEGIERDFQASELKEQTDLAINAVTRFLTARYAVLPSEAALLTMAVRDVDNYRQYRDVLEHLSSLAQITEVTIISAEGNELVLSIATQSSVQRLEDSLALVGKLLPWRDDHSAPAWVQLQRGTRQNPLVYRLAP